MVYERIEADKKKRKNVEWGDCIFEVLLTYKDHGTFMAPSLKRKHHETAMRMT